MKGSPIPEISPVEGEPAYVHENGRVCYPCRYWVGNARDGHWTAGYWYTGTGGWRYCEEEH